MEISDIRVKLIYQSKERLRAVCSVTFDDAFVVRDVKVVDGTSGTFVAMPSRKLSAHCPNCRHKNQIRARFCNECGGKLPPPRPPEDTNGRSRYHRDIAHPINTDFREMIQEKVLEAFEKELAETPEASDGESVREAPVAHERLEEPSAVDTADDRPDPKDHVNEGKQKSEYDSLIAGLNPGRGNRTRESGSRERSEAGGSGNRTDRSETGRERGSRGEQRERPERREEPPAKKFAAPARKPAPPAKAPEPVIEASIAASDDDSDGTQFGAELLVETATPTKRICQAEPEAVKEHPAQPSDDDDGGFGAGLL